MPTNRRAELPYATGGSVGRTVDFIAGRNRYIGYLVSLSRVSFRGLKIGLDCADGSAFFIAKSVFDTLGAATKAIHASPDGRNINLGCGSVHPEALARCVTENGLDMGFAFDGGRRSVRLRGRNGQDFKRRPYSVCLRAPISRRGASWIKTR